MNIVLLIGDHGFAVPRARSSVATTLGASLPRGWCVLDRVTTKGGSRAVVQLAVDAMADFEVLRRRAETAHLFVSMNTDDQCGAGVNPYDWMRRWMRISAMAEQIGWHPTLVRLAPSEEAPKDVRRFHRRVSSKMQEARLDSIVVDDLPWNDSHDPTTEGVTRIATALRHELDIMPVVVTRPADSR